MTTTSSLHPSSARLRLEAEPRQGGSAWRIDGAWWPRSYDLTAELPGLLAGLPHHWGHISSVLVNGTVWSLPGDEMLGADQMVHLRRTDSPRAEHTVCLLAPGHGRCRSLSAGASGTRAGQAVAGVRSALHGVSTAAARHDGAQRAGLRRGSYGPGEEQPGLPVGHGCVSVGDRRVTRNGEAGWSVGFDTWRGPSGRGPGG
jgi:hypothetical protein